MTARTVIKMGHPTLREVAQDVTLEELKTEEFKTLLIDLFETMKVEGGIGIAAPQVNVSKKVTLIQIPDHSRYGEMQGTPLLIIINPIITYLTEETQGFWEGCLSVPGLRGYVERPKKVKINYIDETGSEKEIIAEDFLATVFQHELDHLFGYIYVDRLKDITKLVFEDTLKK